MTFPTLTRRWNPWGDLLSLQDEMNKLFEGSLGTPVRSALLGTEFMPPVDLLKDKENLVVKMDAPGLKKEDLDITVLNGRLFIRGTKRADEASENKSIHRRERFYGSFERVIDLPNPVEVDKIHATFCDGVLTITAPVREEARPRQIAVEVR
jgi:HSP20 family protein